MLSTVVPFFSIIIPTYNRADFIISTVQSVLNQTFYNFELIIVDNCSLDNTKDLIDEINDYRVSYYVNDKNYDRSYSRNRGISIAQGKFVTFLDSDDLLLPNCLQDAYNFHIQNPEVLMFYSNYEITDEQGTVIPYTTFSKYPNSLQNILYGNFLACIGVFVEKKLIKGNPFDTTAFLIGSEDWELWIRIISQIKSLGHIPKVNAQLVEHKGRTMNQFDGSKLKMRTEYIIEKHIQAAEKIDFKYDFLASCYLLIGNGFQESNQIKEAFEYWKKAIMTKPTFLFHKRSLALLKNIIFKKLV